MTASSLSSRHEAVLALELAASSSVQPGTLEQSAQIPRPSLNRILKDLLTAGLIAEQGVSRIDNSYTLGYSSYIYCVFTQRRKPCATPLLIYGHCPSSET